MANRDAYEPRFHKASGQWCKKIGGKIHYLGRDYQVAKRRLTKLASAGETQWEVAPFRGLLEVYADDLKAKRSHGTYRSQVWRLEVAARILPENLPAGQVRKQHLSAIESVMRGDGKSPTTIRDVLSAVQGVINWAIAQDLLPIECNHLTGYRKPSPRRRTRVCTDQEFRALLRCSPPSFRRFLIALRHTGCRPGEVRGLRWVDVLLDQGLWVLVNHKTRTTQQDSVARVIPLSGVVAKLCGWLKQRADHDYVFLNHRGKPYTKDVVVHAMARARQRAGIEGEERIVCYTNRHTFGTNAVGKVSDFELAQLMGHTNLRTTRRYVHMNVDKLKNAMARIGNASKKKPEEQGQ